MTVTTGTILFLAVLAVWVVGIWLASGLWQRIAVWKMGRQEKVSVKEELRQTQQANSILAEQNNQLWKENVQMRERQSVLASPQLLNKIEEFIESSNAQADTVRRFAIFQSRSTNQLEDNIGVSSDVEESFERHSNQLFLTDVEQRLRLNASKGAMEDDE